MFRGCCTINGTCLRKRFLRANKFSYQSFILQVFLVPEDKKAPPEGGEYDKE